MHINLKISFNRKWEDFLENEREGSTLTVIKLNEELSCMALKQLVNFKTWSRIVKIILKESALDQMNTQSPIFVLLTKDFHLSIMKKRVIKPPTSSAFLSRKFFNLLLQLQVSVCVSNTVD